MLFTSYEFLGFLLLLFFLYYIIPARHQWKLLLAAGYVFYAVSGWKNCLFILLTTGSTYILALRIDRIHREQAAYLKEHKKELSKEEKKSYKARNRSRQWRLLLTGLFMNFGILAVLKYTNFAIANVNALLSLTGSERQIGFVSFLLLCLATVFIFLMLKHTKLGKQIRATSQNPTGAQVTGIKTKSIYTCTYGIGAAIAGIAGACLMSFYYVYPSVGNVYGTRSFIVVTMGGLGNVWGAFSGGFVLGILETVGSTIVGAAFKDTLVFVVFILILVIKENLNIKRKRG